MDMNNSAEPRRATSRSRPYFRSVPFESISTYQPTSFPIPALPSQYNFVEAIGDDESFGADLPLQALSNASIPTCHFSPSRYEVFQNALESLLVPNEAGEEYDETQPTNAYGYQVSQSFGESTLSLDAYNQNPYGQNNQESSLVNARINPTLQLKHGQFPTLDKNTYAPFVDPSVLMLRSNPAPIAERTSGLSLCCSQTPSLHTSNDPELVPEDDCFSLNRAGIPFNPLQALDDSWHTSSHVMAQGEPQYYSEIDSDQPNLPALYAQPYYSPFPIGHFESMENLARPEGVQPVYQSEHVSQDVADGNLQSCLKRRRESPAHEETEQGINLEKCASELDHRHIAPISSFSNPEQEAAQEDDQLPPSTARRVSENVPGARGRTEGRETMRLSRRSNSKDNFLVQSKRSGLSYKEIKRRGNFQEAESTLRGRFRTLTKGKDERPRRPRWSEKDVVLLREAVATLIGDKTEANALSTVGNVQANRKKKKSDPFWPAVAKYISDHGGSYRFAHSACHKKWAEIDPQSI